MAVSMAGRSSRPGSTQRVTTALLVLVGGRPRYMEVASQGLSEAVRGSSAGTSARICGAGSTQRSTPALMACPGVLDW